MVKLERYQVLRKALSAVSCLVDNKITCNAPLVKPLEDAVLTCHFPEDLAISKKYFTVYHYDKYGSTGNQYKSKLIKW